MFTRLSGVPPNRDARQPPSRPNTIGDFVEIVEHPLRSANSVESPGHISKSNRRPVSSTPRSFMSNSPLKVRKTRENLRAGKAEREDDTNSMPQVDQKLVVEKLSTRGSWSARLSMAPPVGALPVSSTVSGNVRGSPPSELASTSTPESAKTIVSDIHPAFQIVRRASQRVVTKIRKLSLKGKLSAVSVLPNGASPSMRLSTRHISNESETASTSDPFRFEMRFPSLNQTTIRKNDRRISRELRPSTLFSPITRRDIILSTAYSAPPEFPDDQPSSSTSQMAFRACVQPLTAVSRAIVSIRPEIDAIDLATEATIWTSIQIESDVDLKADSKYSGYRVPSLAVAVVVDSSSFTTEASFERACEQVINVAKLLRCHNDQMAVYFTTSGHRADGRGPYREHEISALGSPNPAQLQRDLAAFRPASPGALEAPELRSTLNQAFDDLNRLGDAAELSLRTAQCEIILIAPHAIDLTKDVPNLDDISLHLISPGNIPFQGCTEKVTGWLLNFDQLMSSTHGEVYTADDMQFSCLAALLITARYRVRPDPITNMCVDIVPGPDTTIEDVIGEQYFAEILPGQIIRILLKLSVRELRNKIRERRAGFFPPNDSVVSLDDAFLDLEAILDELFRELLRVHITYTHSGFPDNTHLVVEENCWIRRPSALQLARKAPVSKSDRKIVQMSLAMALAARSDPLHALDELEKVFGAPNFKCHIGVFLDMIKSDLYFQSRVLAEQDRLLAQQQQRLLEAPITPSHARARRQAYRALSGTIPPRPLMYRPLHLGQSSVQYATPARNSNHMASVRSQQHDAQPRSGDYTAGAQNSEDTTQAQSKNYSAEVQTSGGPALAQGENYAASIESRETDRAQRIWRQIRQLSKGNKENTASSSAAPAEAGADEAFSERMLEIQRTALRNNRSMGADTLRSMARSLDARELSPEGPEVQDEGWD